MPSEFPKMKSGDGLTPWHMNIIYRELDRLRKWRFFGPVAYSGIDSASSPPVVTILGSGAGLSVAKSSSSITARSGATMGSGTVTPYRIVSGSLTATGEADYGVLNYAGSAIDTGKYLLVATIDGAKVVASAEC